MEAAITERCLQPSISSSSSSAVTSQQTLADQKFTQELSPDSGNGEELDEFDPMKTSPKYSETKNEGDRGLLTSLSDLKPQNPFDFFDIEKDMVALPVQAPETKQSDNHKDWLVNCESNGKVTLVSANETQTRTEDETEEKPLTEGDNNGHFQAVGEDNKRLQVTSTGFITQTIPKDCVVHYSDAFSNKVISSSILSKCSSSFHCGPFSGACTPIIMNKQVPEMNGPFSLPEGKGFLHEGVFTTVPYQLNCDKTKTGPFSLPSIEATRGSTTATCTNVYYPEYYNYRNRLVRRYTNPEVVRTQPTSGGLLTTACDLITSPGQCTCINPGTSHACASRPTHKSSPGVLNPVFDQGSCGTRLTSASMPTTPRKFSLDQNFILRDFNLPEFSPTPSVIPICRKEEHIFASHSECQSHIPKSSASDTVASEDGSTHSHNTDTSPSGTSQGVYTCSGTTCSSLSGEGLESLSYKDLGKDLPSLNAMAKGLGVVRSSMKPPVLTSPDWFSFLTPSQESCTQKLFTPGDLQDELMYPSPYGVSSEVYQNLNAQEADFVLQKPNRKPRTEPLPTVTKTDTTQSSSNPNTTDNANRKESTCGESSSVKSEQSLQVCDSASPMPGSPARIIEPLATEDEEALKEGAKESRRLSLSERRKTSLEKIYIPKAVEPVPPVLDVKIDNFDRDEYVNYKKTLGENDTLAQDCPLLPCTILRDLSLVSKSRSSKGPDNKSSESDSSRKLSTSVDRAKDVIIVGNSKDQKQEIASRNRKLSHTQKTEKIGDDTKENSAAKKDVKSKTSQSHRGKPVAVVSENRRESNNDKRYRKNAMSPIISPTKEDSFPVQDKASKKASNFRKQSLPTEELFGARRPKFNRRSSLNPPSDSVKQQGRSSRKSSFDPVQEAEESPFLFDEDTPRRRTLWHRRHVLNARNGDDFFVPPTEKRESPEKSVPVRSKTGQRKRDRIPANRKPEWKNYSENAITVKANASKRNDGLETNVLNPDGYSKHFSSKSHRHRDDSSNSDASSGKEYSKQRRKYSGQADREDSRMAKHRKGKSSKSPRKARHQSREGHVNPMAKLSPLGFESRGDLFANKACSSVEGGVVPQGLPLVPYEPLVEKVTPTSPEAPHPHTGATRKQQSRQRSKKRSSRRLEKHRTASSSSSSSRSSSSSSSSSSRASSSGDSRSTLSSSSSSDSSSSSSSSSDSTTSSSSDSSDIEDLIL